MLYAIAFLVTFVLGGITGIMLAVPPFDAQAQDTYFVVAHFHFVMGGGALLTFLGAVFYWFPKMTGRLISERLGKISFWPIVIGFYTIFFPQHFLGLMGMPRRTASYVPDIGLEIWNQVSTIGTFIMGAGGVILLYAVFSAFKNGKPAGDDPWDGRTLEWATTSPPPYYDFERQPVVNDRDAHWVQKYPESVHGERVPVEASAPYDRHGIHIPGQSWYPFIAAAAMLPWSYGWLYDNMWLVGLSMVVIVFAVYSWALEGVGGKHIHPEGVHQGGTGAGLEPHEEERS
jgi:cytochrome c oxidase subunit I